MRDDGHAAARADPPHRVAEGRPAVLHVSGLAFGQIALENAFHVPGVTAFHEEAREMRAADDFRIADVVERALQAAVHAGLLQRIADSLGPPDAGRAHPFQSGAEVGAVRVDVQANHVKRCILPAHRDFDAIDEAHASGTRLGARRCQPSGIVVVRQGQDFDAVGRRARDDCARVEQAVRGGGMTVKIDVHRRPRLACKNRAGDATT